MAIFIYNNFIIIEIQFTLILAFKSSFKDESAFSVAFIPVERFIDSNQTFSFIL